MRKGLLAAAALVAVVAIFLLATLPPKPVRVPPGDVDSTITARTVAGAYHIHTTRSDGTESKTSIAAAAARAGLQFAIFTDHGDGTRPPDPPEYIDGVLCIDAVEISTNGGHYVALGMPAAPYPLGGDAAAVVEDVARLGGFGLAAHPHHPKGELAWAEWSAPIDGIEWINADTEWRNESPARLARVLFDYLIRPAPAIVSVFDRPAATLQQWDALLQTRGVVAMAAADAHGGARASSTEEGGSPLGIGASYEASFGVMRNYVVLETPPSGNAAEDAARVLGAIRGGRVYTVIEAIASGIQLVPRRPEGPLRFAEGTLPPGVTVRNLGVQARQGMEAGHPNAPGEPAVPWVVANPIVTPTERVPPLPLTPPLGAPLMFESPWRVEKDEGSTGTVKEVPGGFSLTYQLRPGGRASQFVAAAADLSLSASSAMAFSGQADRPMRVSVQLRFPQEGERWVKSVYLDRDLRDLIVPINEMRPAERRTSHLPDLGRAGSILFVIDLTNAKPGDTGALTVTGLRTLGPSPVAPR